MKIGLLTLPFNNNYGGLLQSYALQTYLKKRGHEVYLINRLVDNQCKKITFKKKIKTVVGVSYYRFFIKKKISKNMVDFACRNMLFTMPIYKNSDFEKLKEYCFDAIVVGSDQVWRFDYTKERKLNYFLDFANSWDVKKIAYATSFGVDKLSVNDITKNEISNLLKMFDVVSTREESGVDLCKNYFGTNADLMIDPAFLLSKEDYKKLINTTSLDEGGLLVYMLDANNVKKKIIDRLSSILELKPFIVGPKATDSNESFKDRIYPSIGSWLEGFEKASFIITDSYHGCVFSIIFNKPFIVVGNYERGMARFSSLLSIFNLKSQLITENTVLEGEFLNVQTDFKDINIKIDNYRRKADNIFKKLSM